MMNERLRELIDLAGLDNLAKETDIKGTRWRTVRYDKRTRISTDEVQEITKLFPGYALWLVSGEIAPEIGQTSPAYDKAQENLQNYDVV